jgi:nicotinate-nucleotide adenylyltransferase
MLASLPTWHKAPGVVAAADQIAAAHRPSYPVSDAELGEVEARLPGLRQKLALLPAPQLDLAATSIRERVALALPIRYLVPDGVEAYIARHGLYRPPASVGDPDVEGGMP